MTDYWNSRFKAGKVWGSEPSGTALIASEYFTKYEKKDVLVIGSGYGRNTNYFYENGYVVEGVEYAIDGIEIARRDNPNITYYNGSAFDMPLSDKKYSAVFCYNVIHLFIKSQRDELISICRKVLDDDGMLFFTAFSNEDNDYGIGDEIEDNTFELKVGKPVHFYSRQELLDAFGAYTVINEGIHVESVGDKECKLRYIVAKI